MQRQRLPYFLFLFAGLTTLDSFSCHCLQQGPAHELGLSWNEFQRQHSRKGWTIKKLSEEWQQYRGSRQCGGKMSASAVPHPVVKSHSCHITRLSVGQNAGRANMSSVTTHKMQWPCLSHRYHFWNIKSMACHAKLPSCHFDLAFNKLAISTCLEDVKTLLMIVLSSAQFIC